MRRDRLGLPCRALERRHIGHRPVMRVRRNVAAGCLDLIHRTPSGDFPLNVAQGARVFQTPIYLIIFAARGGSPSKR